MITKEGQAEVRRIGAYGLLEVIDGWKCKLNSLGHKKCNFRFVCQMRTEEVNSVAWLVMKGLMLDLRHATDDLGSARTSTQQQCLSIAKFENKARGSPKNLVSGINRRKQAASWPFKVLGRNG